MHDVPLHDVTFGVWCALSATRIIGNFSFSNIKGYNILALFFENLRDEERDYAFFQEDAATAHTAFSVMPALRKFWGNK